MPNKHLTPTQTKSIPNLFAQYIADGLEKKDAIKRIAQGLGKDVERIRQILRKSVIAIPEQQINYRIEVPAEVIEQSNAVRISQGDKVIGTFPLNGTLIGTINQAKLDIQPQEEIFAYSNQIEDNLLELGDYTVQSSEPIKSSFPILPEFLTQESEPIQEISEPSDNILLKQILLDITELKSKVNAPFIHTPNTEAKVELTKETTTEFFLSDVHWHPEHSEGHDPAAWRICEKAIETIQPDIIYWGGDVVDCYAPSRYEGTPRLKTPEAYDGEISFAVQKLKEVRELAPNARWIWLTGNHEERVRRSVFSNAPWLLGKLQNLEAELNLDQFDCSFVEDGHKIGKLSHFHGHNLAGGGQVNPAKNKFLRLLDNVIYGHLHTFATWYQRKSDGGYYGAFGNGTFQWLSTSYARFPNWQNGWSCNQYAKSGLFNVDQVLIHKPSVWSPHAEAIYQGIHYKVDMSK